jgi:PRTRC genetic system protein E
MDFFQQLSDLNLSGDLRLTITTSPDGVMIASVFLFSAKCGEESQKLMKPLLISGTASEVDEQFFQAVSRPMQATSDFYNNAEAYLKTLEQAKAQSAIGKANPKTEAEKKYEGLWRKSEELEKEGKFKQAWMKVPDPADYPEKETELRERREALSAHFAPDLFS